jgi:hypothetical protein
VPLIDDLRIGESDHAHKTVHYSDLTAAPSPCHPKRLRAINHRRANALVELPDTALVASSILSSNDGVGHYRLALEETQDRQHVAGADTSNLAVVGFKLRLTGQPHRTTAGSAGGPVSSVTRGKRKVIVILTDPALVDRISSDRRRIEILQDHISTVATNKIVPTGARHSSFCTQN